MSDLKKRGGETLSYMKRCYVDSTKKILIVPVGGEISQDILKGYERQGYEITIDPTRTWQAILSGRKVKEVR